MRLTTLRVAVLAATLLLVGPVLAQGGKSSGVIKPIRIERNIKPVKESTLDVFPQIQETFHNVEREAAENLPPPIRIDSTGDNTLPVGGVGDFIRGRTDKLFPGMGATGWVPPDPNIGVGPNNIVQVVNCSVAFFNKNTGQKTFQQEINGANGFFGSVGATDFVFDPKAFYDPVSQRFFIMGLELKDDANNKISKLCIAVSDDNDPAGTWYKYRVEAKLTVGQNLYWMDYPSYASNKDAVAVCGNMFAFSGSGGWGGIEFVVIKKAPMLLGQATTATILRDANSGSGQVGQSVESGIDRIYGAAVASNSSLRIYAMKDLDTTPTLVFTGVSVPSFTPLARDAISTNNRTFWTVDSRLFNLVYRNGRLYTTHHTSVSNSDNRNMVRWYEISTNNWPISGSPTVFQTGTVPGTAGVDTFFPAINVNGARDISIVFSRSSTSITADMMIASRKATDPPGVMGVPQVLMSSQNANYGGPGSNRWGDFFSVQVDVDDNKFWGVSMVGDANGAWQTHILSWQVSSAALPEYDATTVSVYTGQYQAGDVTSIHDSDDAYYDVRSANIFGQGAVVAIEASFTLDKPGSMLRGLIIKAEGQGKTGCTSMAYLWNWNTNAFEHVKSFPMGGTDTVNLYPAGGDLTRFVSANKQVRAIFRSLLPGRIGASNLGYRMRTDLFQILADWQP
ncbi:MAG: hypothetical protein WAO58_05195 [Fimbriimonadaceae bacterium]